MIKWWHTAGRGKETRVKIELITKAAFREGDEIEVNGIPYEIKHVDYVHGLRVGCKIPGLTNDDGSPLEIEEAIAWSNVLQARVV
jgi:hypothetical protein